MTKHNDSSELDSLVAKLEKDLLELYGPMISGKSLVKVLGYSSADAFRQAVSRGTVPVKVFPIENRRGRFALACDIAKWLAEQRYQ